MNIEKIKIAIVGRPNVGKSALFNRICKKRIAIVHDQEGTTRDRIYATTEFFGRPLELIDTGGIDAHSQEPFNAQIKRQAERAMEEADALILVVDAHVGITDLDLELANKLKTMDKPLSLAVNKIDHHEQETLIHQFHKLGITQITAVSATQGYHLAELLESLIERVAEAPQKTQASVGTKLAVIGRPNVGKSTFVNQLLQEERCIVSQIAGTTRDSIDIPFLWDQTPLTLIDTAGLKKKKAEKEVVEKFAAMRSELAIDRSDVCLLMLDSTQGMTAEEKKMAAAIQEAGKGCVLLFNKWDLVKGVRMEHAAQSVKEALPFFNHCPLLFLSAHEGRNVDAAIQAALTVAKGCQTKISTGPLNRFMQDAIQRNHPTMVKGKRLRIYYMVQVSVAPPKFVLFVNKPELMQESYRKYLYNQFRLQFPIFQGVPLIFMMRGKEKNKRGTPASPYKEEAVEWTD